MFFAFECLGHAEIDCLNGSLAWLCCNKQVGAEETDTGKGIEAIRDWLVSQPDKSVACVPTGCLTNIAVMFTLYPKTMHVCSYLFSRGSSMVLHGCVMAQAHAYMNGCFHNAWYWRGRGKERGFGTKERSLLACALLTSRR